jgi:hypothetical protein
MTVPTWSSRRVTGCLGGVSFFATARSPVLSVDDPGYVVRTRLEFAAHVSGVTGRQFAYHGAAPAGGEPFDPVVLVVDTPADGPDLTVDDGAVTMLRRAARGGTVVTSPTIALSAGDGSAA